jgi:ribosomal protein S6
MTAFNVARETMLREVERTMREEETLLAHMIRQDDPAVTWGEAMERACRALGRPVNQ